MNVLQWNINHAQAKLPSLIHVAATEDISIILLQETVKKAYQSLKIPGYHLYTNNTAENDRGLAIYIKHGIPSQPIHNPIFCGENTEVLAVTITLRDHNLDIYNIYTQPTRATLELGQLFNHASNTPTLIGGDFNAHHPILSSIRPTNENGWHIEEILNEYHEVAILNNGEPTHINGGRLDLTFITTSLRQHTQWRVHPTLMSDHFAVTTQLNIPQLPPIPAPPPKWNQDLADWNKFKNHLEEWHNTYIPPDDENLLEKHLTEAFHKAANAAMPKRKPGTYTYKDSWYYCPEVRELKTRLNQVKKFWRKRRTEQSRELLQEVSKDVHKALADIRNKKWLEWCAKLSQYTSLKDLWQWLRRVAGKKTGKPQAHPNPQQKAEELANKFADRTATANLPPTTQQKQRELNEERWQTINHACTVPDITDTPYTTKELQELYEKGRDTAPGTNKITYTMIANMGTAGETAFLRLPNHTHLKQTRPLKWNQQDTQPIPKPKDPDNPRPLSLLSCIEKNAEKMVLKRLQFKTGPLNPHLYAYREGVRTLECIMDVLSCINNKKATVVFIDFEKAFELASHAAILQSLVRKGIKGHLLAWAKNYCLSRQARVKFNGYLSTYKNLENGTPQGGILSPWLFNILMENIASLQLPRGVSIYIYADDVAIVSNGMNRIACMQRALNMVFS